MDERGPNGGEHEDEAGIPEWTREEFMTLPLETISEWSGLVLPALDTEEDERAWREQAWEGYAQDVENRDEWGPTMTDEDDQEGGTRR